MALGFINNIIGAITSGLKASPSDIMTMETCDIDLDRIDENGHPRREAIVHRDASLSTTLRLEGSRTIVGTDEINVIVERLKFELTSVFSTPGHAIQIVFDRDPERSVDAVRSILKPARYSASQLQIDLDDLLNERETVLSRRIAIETVHIVCWSSLACLSPAVIKDEISLRKVEMTEAGKIGQSQNPVLGYEGLRTLHESFVSTLMTKINNAGFALRRLSAHEAAVLPRDYLWRNRTGDGWRPRLLGDSHHFRLNDGVTESDVSGVTPPSITDQTFLHGAAEVLGMKYVHIGDFLYAPMDMVVAPEVLETFNDLVFSPQLSKIPVRASFLFDGGNTGQMAFKRMFASVSAWSSAYSKRLKRAFAALSEAQEEGQNHVVLRVSFLTWVEIQNGDVEAARSALISRARTLQRAIAAWGNPLVSDLVGDPLETLMTTLPAAVCGSTAAASLAPLEDALYLAPIGRPAALFEDGSLLFRTPDGKPWPWQPGSSKQDASIDLIIGTMGKGKSVLLNSCRLAFVLSPASSSGEPILPLMSITDIGPSSSGFISLLRGALPAHRQHEALHVKISNSQDYRINPFDTQLGCPYPMPIERSFIVNMLRTLSLVDDKTYDGISDIIVAVVDMAYQLFAPTSQGAKPFVRNLNNQVDQALIELGMIPENPEDQAGHSKIETFWDAVEALFKGGKVAEAVIAQRSAVPTLNDVAQLANSSKIQDQFGKITVNTGESACEALERYLTSATARFQILGGATKWDVGNARVVSIDLDEVVPRNAGTIAVGVYYLFARHISARNFFLSEEMLPMIPPLYRSYHEFRIRQIRSTPRRMDFDECHRFRHVKPVEDQLEVDAREARKWGIQLAFGSQLLRDFSQTLIDICSNVYVMNCIQTEEQEHIRKTFDISNSGMLVIKRHLNGPTKEGAPMIMVSRTKQGVYEQWLFNSLGPVELWAFSTTPEDVYLRTLLYNKVGPVIARRILASRFSNGSAKELIDQLIDERAKEDLAAFALGHQKSVPETLADELVSKFYEKKASGSLSETPRQ